jgi:hypothetical protein
MLNDLNALFDSVDGLKEDLVEYGTIAAGAIGANVVWNIAVAKYGSIVPQSMRQYGLPALAVLAGIFGGRQVARYNRKLGLGFTIGLVAAGLTQFTKMFVPNLPVAGLASDDWSMPLLDSPVYAEELNALTIEQNVAGAPSTIEQVAGFHAVIQ